MYIHAYQTLTNKIVNPLLEYEVDNSTTNETDMEEIVRLVHGLTCGAKGLYNGLYDALNASERLNAQVEDRSLKLVKEISEADNQKKEIEKQLNSIKAQLVEAEKNVGQAENEVRNQENELRAADSNYAVQQRKRMTLLITTIFGNNCHL